MRTASLCLVAALAVGGCGGGEGGRSATADDVDPDRPSSAPAEPSDPTSRPERPAGGRLRPLDGPEPDVRWTSSGFEVRAFGSGSCPPVASSVEVVDAHSLVIDVEPKGGQACTDDWAPRNSFVAAPDGLSRKHPLVVRLRDDNGLGEPIRVTFLDITGL